MNQTQTSGTAGGVVDHATGAGASFALGSRSALRVGPYRAADVRGSLAYVREGVRAHGSALDSLAGDLQALAEVQDPEANLLHDMTLAAVQIVHSGEMGEADCDEPTIPFRVPVANDFTFCGCGHERYLHEPGRCTGTQKCKCNGFASRMVSK